MKKILCCIGMFIITFVGFAQDYGDYSLPHTTDVSVLQQYIGQRVKVFGSSAI